MIIVLWLCRRTPNSSDRHASYLGEKHHDLATLKWSNKKKYVLFSYIWKVKQTWCDEVNWWIQVNSISMCIISFLQLFCRLEVFQSKIWGRKYRSEGSQSASPRGGSPSPLPVKDPEILGLCEGNYWITRDCGSSSFPVQLASELADCGMISGHKGWTDSSLSGTERKIGPVS